MKRGEVWTMAGGADFASKPRPAVIIQDDGFNETGSVTVCTFTTFSYEAPLFRLPIEATQLNGLRELSRLMVDKVSTVPRTKMGRRLGRLDDRDIGRLNQALIVFLGLGASHRASIRVSDT